MSNHLLNKVSDKFVELTKDTPGFLHFDSLGFFRLASHKNMIFDSLNTLFHSVKNNGGNLLIPTYSYSYTKSEIYSIKDSASDLGRMSDYLRKNNSDLRTSDALFSYLSFGHLIADQFFLPVDYESFGTNSLIASVFNSDGYLISVGQKLHYCTEIHFLEKMLNVSYRIDKDFKGQILSLNNDLNDQTIRYFCRDLEQAEKYNSIVSFERLFIDMKNENLIEEFVIDDSVEISCVRFQQVFSFLQKKLPSDPFYLMKDRTTFLPIKV